MFQKLSRLFQVLSDEVRYGDVRRVLCSDVVNYVEMDDFFKANRLVFDKEQVEIPVVSVDKLSLVELDAPFICGLVKGLDPKCIFEIGTGKGYSARCFLSNMDGGRVFSLDKEVRDVGIAESRFDMLRGDSKGFDFSPFFDGVDLFFVDGNHSYSYVFCDSVNAFRCVRDDGFILWHDFCDSYLGSVSAVLDFTGRYDLELSKIIGTRFAVCRVVKH